MSKILAQGMITLTQLYEGVQVILTPTAVLIPCDSEETPKPNAYINASTNVKAFLGTMDITSGITLGELEYSDSTVKASKTGTKVSITTITTRTGYVDIPVSATINGETIDLGKHRFNFVKQIDGQPGIPGDPGFGYTLNIKGGVRGVAYAANGTNPEPKTSSQFSVELLKNGVKVANPASISWTCGGNLSGASSVATFTPTIKSTYNSESSYVKVSVKEFAASLAVEETIPIICTKHADGLDWINEWNNQYVQVGTEKIITPKIFAGTKNNANELTGVAIGRDVLGGNANKVIGIVGYKKNTPVFSLDQDANFFVSSSGSAGDVKNGTNNAKGLYFDGNDLYISGKVRISGGSTIGESNTLVEDVINNSNLGAQANNKLDNLQIGGRNLQRNTEFKNDLSHWSAGAGYSRDTSKKFDGSNTVYFTRTGLAADNVTYLFSGNTAIQIEVGQTVTASANFFTDNVSSIDGGKAFIGIWFYDAGGKSLASPRTLIPFVNGKWVKCSQTATAPANAVYCAIVIGTTRNGSYYIGKPMFEKGNKATDWSPAPEDIDSALSSKANTTDVYKKTETYTKSETDSAIEVAKDEINLGISSTYETKANVETKINSAVNNVQIGGRNLLPKNSLRLNNSATGTFDSTANTWSLVAPKGSNSWGSGLAITTPNSIVIPYGQGVTYSFEIKVSKQVTWNFDVNNVPVSGSSWANNDNDEPSKRTSSPKTITKVNEWVKCWVYAENSSTKNTNKVDIQDSGSTIGLVTKNETSDVTFYIRNVKVELGNKATDWSPCPTDVENSINSKASKTDVYTKSQVYTKEETNSQINIAKDNINLAVSNTYETKANVETKVNNAVNNIQIGGRNLAKYGCISKYTSGTNTTINDVSTFKVDGGYTFSRTACSNEGVIVDRYVVYEAGKPYIMSFKMKALTDGVNSFHVYNGCNHTSTKVYVDGIYKGTFAQDIPFPTDGAYHKIDLYFNAGTTNRGDASAVNTVHTILQPIKRTPTLAYKVQVLNHVISAGNKIVDWTPAVEDVNADINKKANSTDVYTKTETYTKSETDSKINIAKDNIELGVKNTYETKTNVEVKVNNAINNIQVGGRNLVSDSNLGGLTSNAYGFGGRNVIGGLKNNTTYTFSVNGRSNPNGNTEGKHLRCYIYETSWNHGSWNFGISETSDTTRSITFTTGNTIEGKDVIVGFYWFPNGGNRTGNATVNWCKVEQGNKATDWTPAPEDVAANINAAKNEAINSANNTLTTTIANYYTKEQTNSQINIAKEAINLGVSNTYETKTNVETKVNNAVNNIQVGGRNLWRFTKEYDGTKYNGWVDNNHGSQEVVAPYTTVDGFGVQRIAGSWLDRSQRVAIEANTNYTLSAWIKWENTADSMFFYTNTGTMSGTNVSSQVGTTDYKRVSITFNSGDATVSTCRFECSSNTPYLIYGLKLEKGNKATDWTPAPEDVDSNINAAKNEAINSANNTLTTTIANYYTKDETNSQINIAKEAINLGVSSTYETKANVETKINGISVGGTNLAYDTNKGATAWGWHMQTNGGRTITDHLADGINGVKMVKDGTAGSGWNYVSYGSFKRDKITPATTYIVSFEMKSNLTFNVDSVNLMQGNSTNTLLKSITAVQNKVTANSKAWNKIVFKLTTLDTLPSSTHQVIYITGVPYSANATHYFRNLKLEVGNTATTWSPAPEDIANDITNAKTEAINSASSDATSKVNSAKNELNTAINKKANSSDVYTKSQVYTREETNSQINIAKNEINLGVSNTYETKTNVETKVNNAVNNIQIGGRNLFKDTKDYGHTSMSVWNFCHGSHVNTSEVYNGCKVVRVTSRWGKRSQSIACEKNAEYVISAWVKGGNTTTSIGTYCEGASIVKTAWADNIAVGTAWKRYWGVVRSGSAQTSLPIRIEPNNSSNCDLYICGLMVEKGNKPSEWSPNPEDIDSAIGTKANSNDVYKKTEVYTRDETNSQINVAKNDITLAVSNTYETKANVESKVNTAVNNLQIGGRNLALGTGKATGDVSSGHGGSGYSATDLFSGITAIKTNTEWSGRFFNLKAIAQRGGFKAGDNLILSVYIKSDQNVTLNVTSHRTKGTGNTAGSSKSYTNFTVTPKWQQVWFPFVADEGSLNRTDTRIEVNIATGNNHIHWAGWKLEKGTKPSDWTPAPEDVDSAINSKANSTDVYTRTETDSKINVAKDNITSSISQNYLSKSDATNTYATKSSLTQTTNSITAKFEGSGGYNLLKNSGFKNGNAYWGIQKHNNPTNGLFEHILHSATWGYPDASVETAQIRLSNQSGIEYGIAQSFNTTIGKQYTLSFQYAGHRVSGANAIIRNPNSSWLANKSFTPTNYNGGNSSVNNWGTYSLTFTATATSHTLNIVINSAQDNGYLWIAKPQIVEGAVALPYSPHPSEIYDGITAIDKDGITVTSSNVKSKTQMSANGFKITKTDTNEDVFKVNSDGTLVIKGSITVTGGSIPASNLSGTISADRLDANTIVSKVNGGTTEINGSRIQTGTLSASKITTGTLDASKATITNLNASNITTGTINSDRLNVSTLVSKINSGSTTISGDKIRTGTISSTKGGSYIDLSNGKMALGGTSKFYWDGTNLKIGSDKLVFNGSTLTVTGNITGSTITGGTLKSTNGDMRFDMNNGYMLLYNNGTKIAQTNKNNISGTNIYGVTNGAEYGSYASLAAKTSSNASVFSMMLTAAGNDLPNANLKKGITLGYTLHSNNWDLKLGSSTWLCWRQNGAQYDSFITDGSDGMLRLFGDNGMYLGYRSASDNKFVIAIRENGSHTYPKSLSVFDDGVRPATDNNGYSLEISAPLNMKGQSINQCSNIKTLGLEFIEPIAFNRDGEGKTRTLKVTKSTQNIVEFIGSAAIKNGEAIVDLPNDVSFKNYVVLLTPIGLDRKVSIVEKNDDNFKIVGNDGIVDYVIKFESMDYASYISKSISEDNTDIIVRSEEDKPKEIFLEN